MPQSPLILLVEDDEADAFFAERAFRKTAPHYQMQKVTHGLDAIDYLSGTGRFDDREQFPYPDLMLLDMHLPYKNGSEVLEWIKATRDLGRLWVTLLTGSSQVRSPERVFETHGNVVICRSEFLKPPCALMVQTILSLFEQWQRMHKRFDLAVENRSLFR